MFKTCNSIVNWRKISMERVFQEAKAFVTRARRLDHSLIGRTATKKEIALLDAYFGDRIPDWYCRLITEVPLIHIEVGWQAYEPEDNCEGLAYVEIYQPRDMVYESFKAYPGISILNRGYVCIGGDPIGSGDPYFIHFDADSTAVYQVFQDAGVDAVQILAHGTKQVADSLADFFQKGIVSK